MLKQTTTALFLLATFILATHAWGIDFQEGRYEITSTIKMANVPGALPKTTITRCMSPEDPVPNQATDDANCQRVDMKTQGNTVTWSVECEHEGQKMKGSGKMTYYGDHFEGTIETVMMDQDGNMTMNTAVKGRRVGPCQ